MGFSTAIPTNNSGVTFPQSFRHKTRIFLLSFFFFESEKEIKMINWRELNYDMNLRHHQHAHAHNFFLFARHVPATERRQRQRQRRRFIDGKVVLQDYLFNCLNTNLHSAPNQVRLISLAPPPAGSPNQPLDPTCYQIDFSYQDEMLVYYFVKRWCCEQRRSWSID